MTGNLNWVHSELAWGIAGALGATFLLTFLSSYMVLSFVLDDVGESL